jgi:hypothetical protein
MQVADRVNVHTFMLIGDYIQKLLKYDGRLLVCLTVTNILSLA